jgi:hypothetical protein
VHGRLLGGRPATVDADVGGHRVGLVVPVRALVRRHQAAGPWRGGAVVVPRVVLVGPLAVDGDVRLLLGEQLVQALPAALLLQRGAEPGGAPVALTGVDPRVEHVGPQVVGLQRVSRLQNAVVLGGFVVVRRARVLLRHPAHLVLSS